MRQFTARDRDGKSHTFYTNDNWRGLWSPLSLIGYQYEADGHLPNHKQTDGTCDTVGESAVRRRAREVVNTYVF